MNLSGVLHVAQSLPCVKSCPYKYTLFFQTYKYAAGELLAEELRTARAAGIEVVMLHENDQERGGCEFAIFFDGRTPQFLNGIYNVRVPTALA